jgi:hypothetical protein
MSKTTTFCFVVVKAWLSRVDLGAIDIINHCDLSPEVRICYCTSRDLPSNLLLLS